MKTLNTFQSSTTGTHTPAEGQPATVKQTMFHVEQLTEQHAALVALIRAVEIGADAQPFGLASALRHAQTIAAKYNTGE